MVLHVICEENRDDLILFCEGNRNVFFPFCKEIEMVLHVIWKKI